MLKLRLRSNGVDGMEEYVPDIYQKNIFEINYESLSMKGIKYLLFDLDNTLGPAHAIIPDLKVKELIENLKNKFQIIIFSNAMGNRVSGFAEKLDVDFIYNACKPRSNKFLNVFKKYKMNENEVAIIGDQLFTDIKGGNRVGILTILVDPISKEEFIFTKVNRVREKRLKKKLRKMNLFKGRHYEEKM